MQTGSVILCLIVPLLGGLSPGPSLQDKRGIQIKVESGLVLVDLVVVDSEGRFVPDLRADEIQIFEDNKRREVSFFERKQRDRAVTAGLEPNRASAGEANARTENESATLIFLIDAYTMSPINMLEAKKFIAAYVKSNAGPGDSFMLVSSGAGAQVYQPPTRDARKFQQTLERVPAPEDSSSRLLRFGEELEILLITAKDSGMGQADLTRNAIALGKEFLLKEEKSSRASRTNTISLVKQIGSLPGRKNVLFFSGGYHLKIATAIQDILLDALAESPAGVPPRGQAPPSAPAIGDSPSLLVRSQLGATTSLQTLDSDLRAVVDEANRSQVAFYCVDVRGLMTQQDIRFKGGALYADQLMREEISQPQDYLRGLASGTGGRWFLNRNDLDAGIASAYQDSLQHYELGFVPQTKAKPGTLHNLTIKVLRPNVEVFHRRSYVESGEPDSESRAVQNAFKFEELFQDFPIEADVTYREKKLRATVYVPVRSLSFSKAGDRYRGELSVYMALFDSEGKLYGDRIWFSKTYKLDYGEAEYAKLMKSNNVTSSCQGSVPAGDYSLKIVVRQPQASRTAAMGKIVAVR